MSEEKHFLERLNRLVQQTSSYKWRVFELPAILEITADLLRVWDDYGWIKAGLYDYREGTTFVRLNPYIGYFSPVRQARGVGLDWSQVLSRNLDDPARSPEIIVTEQGKAALARFNLIPAKSEDEWVPASEIVMLGYASEGQLSKLARQHPEIRREASAEDRNKYKKPRLMYVFNKRRIYELTEGAASF